MNTTPFTRRLTASVSGPLVAAGIVLGTMVIGDTASANAQPTSAGQWAGMTMTGGQQIAGPNALIPAGQGGAAALPGAPGGSMTVDCHAASHG